MVHFSIIVVTPVHDTHTSTGSLSLYIKTYFSVMSHLYFVLLCQPDIPPVFYHPYHLTFSLSTLPKLQFLILETLPVLRPQDFHHHFHIPSHHMRVSLVEPLFPVKLPVLICQALHLYLRHHWTSLRKINPMLPE